MPDDDYAAFRRASTAPGRRGGAIGDDAGRVLGTHDGVHRFTVGQRKGLGLSSPMPLYVVGDRRRRTADGHGRAARRRSSGRS